VNIIFEVVAVCKGPETPVSVAHDLSARIST
jgi:hypothetical protein